MTLLERTRSRLHRAASVGLAFLRMGYLQSIAYPLGFFTEQAGALVPAVIYMFVGRLVQRSGPDVGGDYYTYVVTGLLVVQVMAAGVAGFTREIDLAVVRGNFEMLLVEPVPWKLLPFGMVLWPGVLAIGSTLVIGSVSTLLGAQFRLAGIPQALAVAALAMGAGLSLGILSASVKILAKRGDPILFIYMLGAQIFSGVYFPIDLIPSVLRPISWVIPHTYANVAMRKALMPQGAAIPGLSLSQALLALALFNIIGLTVGLWVYGRSMETGRKYGLLAGY